MFNLPTYPICFLTVTGFQQLIFLLGLTIEITVE